MGLKRVRRGYRGSQRATRSDKALHGVRRGYRGLRGYIGLQEVTRAYTE